MRLLSRKAFTLIEVLTVIAIIGILASLAVAMAVKALDRTRDANRVNNIQEIRNALEVFYNDNGYYPASGACGATVPNAAWCNSIESLNASGQWIRTNTDSLAAYLPNTPVDPANIHSFPGGGFSFYRGAYYYFAGGYGSVTPSSQWYMLVYTLDLYPNPAELLDGISAPDGTHFDYGNDNNGIITVGNNRQ